MSASEQAAPVLLRLTQIAPKQRGGGVRSYPLVRKSIGATSFLTGITEFEPGCSVPLHFHNCDESVTVLEGEAVATIDSFEYIVRTGDTTFIPPGFVHCFANRSVTARLRILWVYGSLDADKTIVATGENRRIDDEFSEDLRTQAERT